MVQDAEVKVVLEAELAVDEVTGILRKVGIAVNFNSN